jgi:hypothetical protein
MTGRTYYLTTLGAWRRNACRYANSHWVPADPSMNTAEINAATTVLALVEADEGAHLALEQDAKFEALPPVLAAGPVSTEVAMALSKYGLAAGATTLDVAEAVGRVHPLMRYRVF